MMIGKVVGNVVATRKIKELENRKMLIIQPLNLDGKPKGRKLLGVDTVDAGVGDIVLYIDEGNSARAALQSRTAPLRVVIIGVIDSIDLIKNKNIKEEVSR